MGNRKRLSDSDKLEIIKTCILPFLESKINEAKAELEQAKEDLLILNSADGDRESVRKKPIFSVVEAQVSVEFALGFVNDIKKVFNSGV